MLTTLTIVYREERAKGALYLVLKLLAALRIMFFPNAIIRFNSMNVAAKLYNPMRKKHDPLYFLAHTYYISKYFTLRQRVQCAINHHEYELKSFVSEYTRQVYHSDGILLWKRSIDDSHFTIILMATNDNMANGNDRLEGDLSVVLSVNGCRLCKMSFCYLNANVFLPWSHMTMLISQNQTVVTPSRELYDRCFKKDHPQLFCLAAICGIATANEFKIVFGIKHDAQLSYQEIYKSGFRRSYDAFWEKSDPIEIDRHVYMLNVPLANHKGRARVHRGYWDEIVRNARSAMVGYRLSEQSIAMS